MSLVISDTSSCGAGGKVIRTGFYVDSPAALSVTVANADGTLNLTKLGIATNVETSQSVIAQFQNTLDDAIYVVPFGDAVGDSVISFVINNQCITSEGTADNDLGTQDQLVAAYLTNRLKPSTAAGMYLAIGGLAMIGFIVGLRLSGTSDGTPMVRGTILFKSWPT